MRNLRAEHHLHLYGCLTEIDLFERGHHLSDEQKNRLQWYAAEFEKQFARKIDPLSYWTDKDGFNKLRRDFLCLANEGFDKFQARFNLIIALCKIKPDDMSIAKTVFKRLQSEGLIYAEVRTILPPYFSAADIDIYLKNLCQLTLNLEKKHQGFTPKFAISLPRQPPYYEDSYRILRKWMNQNSHLANAISAIDFAFYEEEDPPKGKKSFIQNVLIDNKKAKHKLAILYHVGESFKTISIASSARWVWQTAQMGVHRIGHALSLAINPFHFQGETINEKVEERIDHLNWLLENKVWLNKFNYSVDSSKTEQEMNEIQKSKKNLKTVPILYTHEYCNDCYQLQNALLQHLKNTVDPIIECCPSSNFCISQIKDPKEHPIKRFLEHKLKVCISTDDPGIFATNLEKEAIILQEKVGLTAAQVNSIAAHQMDYCSQKLSSQ